MKNARVSLRSGAAWAALLLFLPLCCGSGEKASSADVPVADLVALFASGDFVELTPAGAPRYLGGIVDVAPQPAEGNFWAFSGEAADAGIRWAWLEFEPDGSGTEEAWKLIQIQIALPVSDAAGKSVYDALIQAIEAKLGKPGATETHPQRRIAGWELRDRGSLTILEAELMHPETRVESRGVMLTAAIMAGEEEG